MATDVNDPEPGAPDEAALADLRVAIRLVSRGMARRVTIAGVLDPEAATAAVAGAASGVSIEIVAPRDPTRAPSAIRVMRATAVATAALHERSPGAVDVRPSVLMSQPARS
jgi:hypothetical protein